MNELTSALSGEPCCEAKVPYETQSICPSERTILDKLNMRRADVARDLRKIDEAIESLTKNPEIADALNKVGKALQVRY